MNRPGICRQSSVVLQLRDVNYAERFTGLRWSAQTVGKAESYGRVARRYDRANSAGAALFVDSKGPAANKRVLSHVFSSDDPSAGARIERSTSRPPPQKAWPPGWVTLNG